MSLPPYVRKGRKSAAVGDFDDLTVSDAATIGGALGVGGILTQGVATSITARAGGTKALATVLTKQLNRITVCASANDSVLLPPAQVGAVVAVFNDGAAAARVFGAGTDTIDGVATGTGVPLANAKRALFICFAAGAWVSAQLGVVSA